MIVTDRFVFLHLHKSGGTFVNECLLRFLPDARQVGYHLPRSMTPPAAVKRKKTVLKYKSIENIERNKELTKNK